MMKMKVSLSIRVNLMIIEDFFKRSPR